MTDEQPEPVVVPHLDRATLQAVIESFALREGTVLKQDRTGLELVNVSGSAFRIAA